MGTERPVRVFPSQDESQEEKGAGEAQQVILVPELHHVEPNWTCAADGTSGSLTLAGFLSADLEAVPPGVSLGAEGGPRLDPALALQSPPSPAPGLAPAPPAGPAPTQDPGVCTLAEF